MMNSSEIIDKIRTNKAKKNNLLSDNSFIRYLKKHKLLYVMLIPGIIYFFVYKYLPLAGVLIAFKDYNFMEGVFKSPWVGVKYFKIMFQDPYFWRVFFNTLIISIYKLIWGFPAPVILALLINEVKNKAFKRFVQSISYIPHFLSWIVVGGIFLQFFYRSGYVNNVIIEPLLGKRIDFFAEAKYFRTIIVSTDIWKNVGWSSIIYLAAITGVNVELYEAAIIDGANRFKQVIHVTIPSIASVITIVLVLNVGGILNAGFEQIYTMSNPLVYSVADIIDTFVYRVGMIQADYSYSSAVGLFKGVIGMIMVLGVNRIARELGQEGIW